MAPSKIRVKLISEIAEFVTVSPVVQRDYDLAELVEVMLPVLGRDAGRIRHILGAGTIATGDYRYRWEAVQVSEEEVATILQQLPGPDPSRRFQPERCYVVRFRRGHEVLDLPRESAARKPLFARQSFWEGLLEMVSQEVRYADYSHADRADVYCFLLGAEGVELIEGLLPLLRPRMAAERLRQFRPEQVEWLSRR